MWFWIGISIYILVSAVIIYREVEYKKKDASYVVIYLVLSELALAISILYTINYLLEGVGL